jgi:hypothetical protein
MRALWTTLAVMTFVALLALGLWGNWQGWWQAVCIVAFLGVMILYGVQLDRENRRRAGKREQERRRGE